MALNRIHAMANLTIRGLAVAQAASRTNYRPVAGDPVRIGQIPGVALLDADANDSYKTTVQTDGVFNMLIGGVASDASGADTNSAVKGGDALYFDESKTPPVSKRSSGGIFYGYCLADHNVQVVASGATTTLGNVKIGK